MKTARRSPKPKPPALESSPSDATELVDQHDLSEADRKFLDEHEATIAAGRRTFLEVGQALLEIRNYENGRLYKRFGTFEAYCQKRWELGRSYASRIMAATEVYLEMLPRGNKTGGEVAVLPTTEKQLRSLTKLPGPLRLQAWKNAVDAAGGQPLIARFVEKAVKKVMAQEKIAPAASKPRRSAKAYRISAQDMKKIQGEIARIRKAVEQDGDVAKILEAVERLETLVPS